MSFIIYNRERDWSFMFNYIHTDISTWSEFWFARYCLCKIWLIGLKSPIYVIISAAYEWVKSLANLLPKCKLSRYFGFVAPIRHLSSNFQRRTFLFTYEVIHGKTFLKFPTFFRKKSSKCKISSDVVIVKISAGGCCTVYGDGRTQKIISPSHFARIFARGAWSNRNKIVYSG